MNRLYPYLKCPRQPLKSDKSKGFSLIELLLVLTLSSFFVGSLFHFLICFEQSIAFWDRSLWRQQALSATLFYMIRDIRMAGSNPFAETTFSPMEMIPEEEERSTGIDLYMDKRGARVRSGPDGDCEDPDENILFYLDKRTGTLRRNGQPMALGISENPEENPLFIFESRGERGLVNVWLTTGAETNAFSLSTAVHIRNAFND